MKHLSVATLILTALGLVSCAHPPLKRVQDAMRPVSAPVLADDLPLPALFAAVETEIRYLESVSNHNTLNFGEKSFSKAEYLAGLRHFVELGRAAKSPREFFEGVERDFDFHEVYGGNGWGEILLTSYYSPVLSGARRRTEIFRQPIYMAPPDMVELDLSQFDPKYSEDRKLRARLVDGERGKKAVPYYTREEIDIHGALAKKKLELCWVDPIDAFVLQVQGSGIVHLDNGKSIKLIYAEKNGQRYESIGKFLRKAIPDDQMSMQRIEAHLRSLPFDEMQRILNLNPSYVFFKTSDVPSVTSLGVSAADGRTIAVDPKFFPKGALAFLSSTKPLKTPPLGASADKIEWTPFARFVLDQDMGGAIQGGGRADLFWGSGEEAKLNAGVMKQPAKLYYLTPKRTQ